MAGILYDVVGLGNAIVDIIAPVEDSFLDRFNIRKNGMTLIDEARADALPPQRLRPGSSLAGPAQTRLSALPALEVPPPISARSRTTRSAQSSAAT